MPARPLSAEWLAQLATRLGQLTVGEPSSERLVLGQIVTGTPDGTLEYVVRLGGGEPGALTVGSVEGAEVILIEDYLAASELLAGASVASLLEQGRIKLRGPVTALLRAEKQLAALGAALAAS